MALTAAGALKIADRSAAAQPADAPTDAPTQPLARQRLTFVVAPLEVVLGVSLMFGVLRPLPAAAALLLLAGFTAYVARALARPAGARPRCACFGALSKKPVGPLALARNVALMALSAIALVG